MSSLPKCSTQRHLLGNLPGMRWSLTNEVTSEFTILRVVISWYHHCTCDCFQALTHLTTLCWRTSCLQLKNLNRSPSIRVVLRIVRCYIKRNTKTMLLHRCLKLPLPSTYAMAVLLATIPVAYDAESYKTFRFGSSCQKMCALSDRRQFKYCWCLIRHPENKQSLQLNVWTLCSEVPFSGAVRGMPTGVGPICAFKVSLSHFI